MKKQDAVSKVNTCRVVGDRKVEFQAPLQNKRFARSQRRSVSSRLFWCGLVTAAIATSNFFAVKPAFAAPAKSGTLPAGLMPLPAPPASKSGSTGATTRPAASPKASTPNASAVVSKDYVLGPDDNIALESLTHNEVSFQGLITSDGKINVPQVGVFVATGKTIPQLEREVLRRMNAVGLVNPTITITLRTPRPQRVFVLKSQGGAGVVEIRPGWRVSDVLAMANGLGDLPPELVEATLTRPQLDRPIKLDLPSIIRDSNSKANIIVQNGDTLRVTPLTVKVSFAGKITRPGTLDVPIGSTIVEAIALAGGVQTKAALTRATLKRSISGEIIPLNLFDVLVKGLPEPAVKLEDGDLIIVPEAQERVTVQGAVGRPGYYDIEDGKTLKLSEVIALAGGPSAKAAISRTIVQRADGTSRVIDLFKVLALQDEESNIELKTDDIITVPEYSPQVIVAGTGIRSAGYVQIEEGTSLRVLGALTKAGGLAGEPEAVRITITRNIPGSVPTLQANGSLQPTILTVDPVKLYKQSDVESNITLQDGDLIMVTSEPRKIYLAGEVRSPGSYELEAGEGLTEILTRAGGVTEEGLLSGVIVERGGQKYTVDVFKALNKGEEVAFPLQAGDNIVVPENMSRVLILPGVGEPGYHAIPEDRPMTVPEALAMAKGTTGDAELKKVMLLRQTAQGLKPQALPLDTAEQYVAASKIVLNPGDILYVPQRGTRTGANLGSKLLRLLPFATMALGSPFPLF